MTQENEAPAEYRTPRALMVAVVGMGVLIVVGTALLIGVILHRMNGGDHKAPAGVPLVEATPAPTGPGAPVVHLPLGVDEHLLGLTRVQDGLVAIQVSGPHGDRVLLWQVGTGQVRPGLDTAVSAP
ncbi:MAG: hypothetical protein ABF593_06260 [Acetobacter papayae]|uniref:hypothetical protein n=1 Tax=Acetobacter papayae TaxID=1076592 RepID=UPI0039E84FF5